MIFIVFYIQSSILSGFSIFSIATTCDQPLAHFSGAKFQPRHQPGARADEEQGNLLTVATGSWLRAFWDDQEVVDPQARWFIFFMENPFFNNMDDFPGEVVPWCLLGGELPTARGCGLVNYPVFWVD